MRIRFFISIIIVFLLCGLSDMVSADWWNDSCGEAINTEKDLMRARAEMFPDPNFPEEEPWIYLCYEMCPGSTIPGITIWEFDVDHNVETGDSSSMLGLPLFPCPCKVCGGFDIHIMEAYRDQGPDSTMQGRRRGEWYAFLLLPGLTIELVDWGRNIPMPPETSTEGRWCEKLPWGQILRKAKEAGADFDLDFALNNPPLWQMSVYYDQVFADLDDWTNSIIGPLNISDWLPDGGCNKASGQLSNGGLCHYYQQKFHCCMDLMCLDEQGSICLGNFDGDQDVDGTDAANFKASFGRSQYTNPCSCDPL